MKTGPVAGVILLVVFCTLCGPVAAQSPTSADALIDRLLAAPRAGLDPVLAENRAKLDVALLRRIMERSMADAQRGKPEEARTKAELADDVDFFMRNKRDYRGLGQSNLGHTLARQGNIAMATSMAKEILRRNPDSYYGHVLQAFILSRGSDLQAAMQEASLCTTLRPEAEEPHVLLGDLYTRKGDLATAKAEFEYALKINPNNAYVRDALATLSGQSGSGGGTRSGKAQEHLNRAEELFKQRKYEEAIAEYRKSVSADPKFGSAWVYMGDAYLGLGNSDEAIACYKKAIEVEPKNRQAHRFLGDVYEGQYDKTGDRRKLELAIACYENALKADPSYHTARQDLERARGKQKKATDREGTPRPATTP